MGLVRRLLIWATVDGLILQAHGPAEHHKAIQIDYQSSQIKDLQKSDALAKKSPSLEAHGIVGRLLTSDAGTL